MNKKMQDMVPHNNRSIRSISLDREQKTKKEEETQEEFYSHEPPRFKNRARHMKLFFGSIGGLIVVGVLVALFSSFLSTTKVVVTTQEEQVVIDGTFTAGKEVADSDIGFSVITLNATREKVVTATGEEQVDKKASGVIVVFNDYDANPQRLIKNTRFETAEGLVYRIAESIIVPGQHKDEKGVMIPGSIEVEVFADTSGEQYNIGLSDFTIPGFKEQNDPRFSSFYARSKTPMTGGFSGIQKKVSETDEETTRATLQQELEKQLRGDIRTKAGDDVALFDDGMFLSYRELPNKNTDTEDTVAVVEEGTIFAIVFKKDDISSLIARETIARYSGEEVLFSPIRAWTSPSRSSKFTSDRAFVLPKLL